MNKFLLTILSVLFFFSISFAQSGTWSGNIGTNTSKIPLIFHLEDKNPTLDSPAQGVIGMEIQIDRKADGDIFISVPMIAATFEGKYEKDEINGFFKQGGFSVPLTLNPGEDKPERFQTPKPPFPYAQEEVSFTNGDAILKGTLTLPENYTKDTPVLLMITGSGLQNRDEELFGHKPFAVIADALARNGIATLRYDDRGFGESKGDIENYTIEDLKNDALSGINLLRKRFNNVGVLGHSEGGTIALMLGADIKVDFIVSLAGMIVSGRETLIEQNRYLWERSGFAEQTVDNYIKLLSLVFDNDASFNNQLEKSNLPEPMKQNLRGVSQQLKSPYMRHFLTVDVRPLLPNVECPVMALNGTRDTQVFYGPNLDALKNGLKENEKNKIEMSIKINHLFQNSLHGMPSEYYVLQETISPEILTQIVDWIQSL